MSAGCRMQSRDAIQQCYGFVKTFYQGKSRVLTFGFNLLKSECLSRIIYQDDDSDGGSDDICYKNGNNGI